MKPSRPKEERAQDQIERGMAAARLIDDALVQGFFSNESKRLVEEMTSAPVSDDDGRRAAAIELQALRKLQSYLQSEAALGRKQQEKAKTHG